MKAFAFSLLAAAEARTLAVTWEDCGSQHSKITDLQPTTIKTGGTTTLTGTGTVDEDVTSATFSATIKADGVKVASCSGDATEDIVCKLPLGAGQITVKKVDFPLKAGEIPIPVDVKTIALIPASLENVDAHIEAVDQIGESVICMDVHTSKAELASAVTGTLAVTWEDCGSQHSTITDLQPTSIQTGGTTTLTGVGTVDEDVTSATFSAVIKALGVKVASCSGDATTDIVCKLPLGAGQITVKAVDFPLKAGEIPIPVDVKTIAVIPASLEKVDAHIEAVDQNGESVICMDVHTSKAKFTDVDCSTAACPDQCQCGLDKCTDAINTCLADASCAQGQTCALACPR